MDAGTARVSDDEANQISAEEQARRRLSSKQPARRSLTDDETVSKRQKREATIAAIKPEILATATERPDLERAADISQLSAPKFTTPQFQSVECARHDDATQAQAQHRVGDLRCHLVWTSEGTLVGPGKDTHGTPVPTQWEGRGVARPHCMVTQHKDASPSWHPRMVAEQRHRPTTTVHDHCNSTPRATSTPIPRRLRPNRIPSSRSLMCPGLWKKSWRCRKRESKSDR